MIFPSRLRKAPLSRKVWVPYSLKSQASPYILPPYRRLHRYQQYGTSNKDPDIPCWAFTFELQQAINPTLLAATAPTSLLRLATPNQVSPMLHHDYTNKR